MDRNFEPALSLVLENEGGYVNNPHDPGGATNLGITIGTAKRVGLDVDGDGDTDTDDIKLLKPADAAKVYRAEYWDKIQGDVLPNGLDYALFDFAVNSGPGRAVKTLQGLLGVKVDGQIGPQTLAAIDKVNLAELINDLCDGRLAFLTQLSTFAVFGKGWRKRVAQVRADALKMAAPGTPSTKPLGPAVPEKRRKPAWVTVAIILAFLMVASVAFFFGH
jgi:lysozyme family protein